MHSKKIGIIGGGPAGIATALRLKQHGFDILLFEANKSDQVTVGEHLAAEALHELRKLKVPESILKEHSIPCTEVQNAWGSSEIHHNESIFNPFGDSYILSRPHFDSALLQHCKKIGVNVQSESRISKTEKIGNQWQLFTSNETFNVDFLIDASGRNSKFNFGGSIEKKSAEFALIGITKHLESQQDFSTEKSHLLVESSENGWWYTVRIKSGKMISTFMTDPKLISESKVSQNDFWNRELKKTVHTKERLQSFEMNDQIFTQSAHSYLAKHIQGNDWLKVGDAAQSFDPLSSAGIIKGLKMGISAADSLYEYIHGDYKALFKYEEETRVQYQEYKEKRDEYYSKEIRWVSSPFWYQRVLKIKEIQNFTITPVHHFEVIHKNAEKKIAFLNAQLPEINFKTLLSCIEKFSIIKDAIPIYLKEEDQKQMNPWLLHALESLKIIGLIQ